MIKRLNQYLKKRGDRWYYQRRVPRRYADFDDRGLILKSLKTEDLRLARTRRDALVEADEQFWSSVVLSTNGLYVRGQQTRETLLTIRLYKAAKAHAMAKGFVYTPITELAEKRDWNDIVNRVEAISKHKGVFDNTEAKALLGTVSAEPSVTISQALQIYFSKIAIKDQSGKSKEQLRLWRNGMLKVISNFVKDVGGLPMDKIHRSHAMMFQSHLLSASENQTLAGYDVDTEIRDLQNLFFEYNEYVGDEDAQNPFQTLV